MKNKLFILVTVAALVSSTVFFTSCGKSDKTGEEAVFQRITTEEATPISDIPTKNDEIIALFNQSVNNVKIYKSFYEKSVNRKISDLDVGKLISVSNSSAAFKSIFGEKQVNYCCDYDENSKSFNANLPDVEITEDEISTVNIENSDDRIIITVEMTAVENPDSQSGFYKLCKDFMSVDEINENAKSFSTQMSDATIIADNITAVAEISKINSDLIRYTVSFTEKFRLYDVILSDIEGDNVTAKAEVKIEYNNFS